jgi:hypothetical protein
MNKWPANPKVARLQDGHLAVCSEVCSVLDSEPDWDTAVDMDTDMETDMDMAIQVHTATLMRIRLRNLLVI